MAASLACDQAAARPRVRLFAAGIAVAFLSMGLAGCSNAGQTTCAEWSEKSTLERNDIAKSMLRSNDLSTSSFDNITGITKNINDYCGIFGLPGNVETPRNASSPIDNAVDWASKTW